MARDPSSSTGLALKDIVYQTTKSDEALNGEKVSSQANNLLQATNEVKLLDHTV